VPNQILEFNNNNNKKKEELEKEETYVLV